MSKKNDKDVKSEDKSEEITDMIDDSLEENENKAADEEITEAADEAAEEVADEASDEVADKAADEAVDEKAANAEFRKLPFIEKCKKDPIIPVSILLAFVAVIIAAIYFMLPNAKTPTMGIGLSDFVQRFNNGAVAASLLQSGADIGFRTPPYVDPESKPSIMGDKAVITASSTYADFFAGPSKYFINAGIEGATRKNDGTISYVRIWVQYSDLSDDADFNSVWMYFSNTLNALYPDMSVFEAMGVAMQKMGEFDGDPRFYVRDDYAFRLVPVQKDGTTYIVVDVVPKYILNDAQIREVLVPGATVDSSETVAESVADTAPAST